MKKKTRIPNADIGVDHEDMILLRDLVRSRCYYEAIVKAEYDQEAVERLKSLEKKISRIISLADRAAEEN